MPSNHNKLFFCPFSAQPLPEFTSIVIRQTPPLPNPAQQQHLIQEQEIQEVSLESLPEMVTELFETLPQQPQPQPQTATIIRSLTPPCQTPRTNTTATTSPATSTSSQQHPNHISTAAVVISLNNGQASPLTSTPTNTVTSPLQSPVHQQFHQQLPPQHFQLIQQQQGQNKDFCFNNTNNNNLIQVSNNKEVKTEFCPDGVLTESTVPVTGTGDGFDDLDLTELLNDEVVCSGSEDLKMDNILNLETLYADVQAAKLDFISNNNFNRSHCWESGSSSSSSGSHFEFACTQDISDMMSDFGVSEADWTSVDAIKI